MNISIDGDNLAQGIYMPMNTILVLLKCPQQLVILKVTENFEGCLDKRIPSLPSSHTAGINCTPGAHRRNGAVWGQNARQLSGHGQSTPEVKYYCDF